MSIPATAAAPAVATTALAGGQQYTCATGQVIPFSLPRSGVDQTGRNFFFNVDGWYGPYDGIGYPVVTNTIGFYGGQSIARSSRGYIPSPCPVAGGGLASFSGMPVMPSTMGMPSMMDPSMMGQPSSTGGAMMPMAPMAPMPSPTGQLGPLGGMGTLGALPVGY